MSGSNLPPGCNISDIPGNRPEDMEIEAACEYVDEQLEKLGINIGEYKIFVEAGKAAVLAHREAMEEHLKARDSEYEMMAGMGQCPFCKQKR